MTILYSNGCSFTANFDLEANQRYPFLIGEKLKWDVIQAGEPGSCNSRIIRRSYCDCLELLPTGKKIVALVQLTFLQRTEFPNTPEERLKSGLPDLFKSVKPGDKSLPVNMLNALKIYTVRYNHRAYFVDLLTKLVGLTCFFKQNNIDYFIFFGPKTVESDLSNEIFPYIKQDQRILDLINFNMLDLTGKQLHPTAESMITIAYYFFNLLNNPANKGN